MPDKRSETILSFFSESFSRPSFKFFSCFIISFIQLGKEVHTSSMVRSLAHSILHRHRSPALPDSWENTVGLWRRSRRPLCINSFRGCGLLSAMFCFLSWMIRSLKKTGKKIPGCGWHKDHAQNMANVFGHQWVLSALLYKDFLLPLWAKLYHPKGTRGCGPFETKIALAQKYYPEPFDCLIPCKLYILADSWYWAKTLAQGLSKVWLPYDLSTQIQFGSLDAWEKNQSHQSLDAYGSSFREISLFVYGKNKTLEIARFIGDIKGLGKVAVVVVKEKRKKPIYLVCTNLHLPAFDSH